MTRKRSQALADVQSYLHERVAGMSVIKSFAIEEHEQQQFDKINGNFLNKALEHTRWTAKAFAVVNTLTDIAPLIVITYAGYHVIHGNLSLGTMVAFIAYIDRLYNPLRRLVNSSITLTQSIASMDRVFELMDEKYDVDNLPNAKECTDVKGRITFDSVQFAYNEKDGAVLKDIDLDIQPGETVALVGMSGGGKSSLISLISRFMMSRVEKYCLMKEMYVLLKCNLYATKSEWCYKIIFYLVNLFKENILFGNPEATDEEVIQAAKAANAHDFIVELADGYDTKVGERGVKLSGGQKQRIAIARVFLKNPPILILDEATSALDLESEQLIQVALDELARDRTTLIVAHRLSTITHADRIVLIEHGRIVEIGKHEELMEKKGHYYDLFQVQQLSH